MFKCANLKGYDKDFQVLNGKKKNISYFEEIKPALIILQIVGRFPYRITKTGVSDFSFFSIPTIYTILFFIGSCALGIWSNLKIFQEKVQTAKEFDILIFWLLVMLFGVQTFIVPITYWWDAPVTVSYIQKWKHFEDYSRKDGFELLGAKIVHLSSYVALPFSTIYIIMDMFMFTEISYMVFIQFIPIIAGVHVSLTIWWGTLYELKNFSRNLATKIVETTNKYDLSYRRQMSIKLNRLVKELGYAMGGNMLSLCLIFFTCFVLCVYGALADIGRKKESYRMFFGLVGGSFLCGSPNFLLCETGDRATKIMKNEFSLKILKTDVTAKSDAYISEIRLILKGMTVVPPVIEYNGFVTANRQMFTHIVGNAVTYLIVLVQFKGTPITCDEMAFNTTITDYEQPL